VADRLAWLNGITLAAGSHVGPANGACIMEAVSYVAGEAWSDSPACVSPAIAAFMRRWNDCLLGAARERLLKPLLLDVLDTATTPEDERVRAWMALDWMTRVNAPAWLRLAGLGEQADAMSAMAPLVDITSADAGRATMGAAKDAAHAAARAAREARHAAARATREASAAARDAASHEAAEAVRMAAAAQAASAAMHAVVVVHATARADAGAAAWDAARAGAVITAWDAALAAAWAATGERLDHTVAELQESAADLVRRMCAIGRGGAS